jgi:hypothetical protein
VRANNIEYAITTSSFSATMGAAQIMPGADIWCAFVEFLEGGNMVDGNSIWVANRSSDTVSKMITGN